LPSWPIAASNSGVVVSGRGSVVDMRFDAQLPPIYSLLRAGEKNQIVIEVPAQLDARRVRGIALTPTQGLADAGLAPMDASAYRIPSRPVNDHHYGAIPGSG
jgi:F0F1-type ATP synthase beta subunit